MDVCIYGTNEQRENSAGTGKRESKMLKGIYNVLGFSVYINILYVPYVVYGECMFICIHKYV